MEAISLIAPSHDELVFIASLDYGQGAEQHLAALRSVLSERGGIVGDGQHWYPYEVIELGANWLQPGHEREFALCTLLVIENVAAGADTSTDLVAKLAGQAADYDRLPAPLRDLILSAYEKVNG
jgi:hypothetical protein